MNIAVTDLTFTYPSGVQALRGVTLTLLSGEAVAIVGENGAGKTTLVKQFNGLLHPTSGSVTVGEWDTRSVSVAKLASRVGYVFQNPDDQLFERSVIKEASFGPRNLGRSEEASASAAAEALAMVGLEAEVNAHPYDLHLSQRKLLALAAILAMRTPVVVLDEPTTGQDAAGIARISAIVDDLKAEGRTVITISHDVDFAAEHFERHRDGWGRCCGGRPTSLWTSWPGRAGAQLARLARAGLQPAHPAPGDFVDMVERRTNGTA